jgi:hypothetical protein
MDTDTDTDTDTDIKKYSQQSRSSKSGTFEASISPLAIRHLKKEEVSFPTWIIIDDLAHLKNRKYTRTLQRDA